MHNRLVTAVPRTQKHQQHVICGLISLTCVVSGAFILQLDTICFKAHIGIITAVRRVGKLMCMLMFIRWECYHICSCRQLDLIRIYMPGQQTCAQYLFLIVFECISNSLFSKKYYRKILSEAFTCIALWGIYCGEHLKKHKFL